MNNDIHKLSQKLMHKGFDLLSQTEKRVLKTIEEHHHISRNAVKDYEKQYTFGQRVADKIAAFGGSWAFILLFAGILATWIGLNSYILIHSKAFDPFPYILLNLVLSMVAAFQAPFIMMSQNRQAAKDRADAESDFEVNLKAELEIMRLHEKIDKIQEQHLEQMLSLQKKQMDMIENLIEDAGINKPQTNKGQKI